MPANHSSPLPLIAPRPPRLSDMIDGLKAIEQSGIYTNGGPVVRRFESAIIDRLYHGIGACLAVPSATIGLMLAIGQARQGHPGDLALMPSFTFAATAHAALWAGLTPVLIDSDPHDWAACAEAESRAIAQYGERIAVIVPYDTFGTGIDCAHYTRLAAETGARIVVDAAASLGNRDSAGLGFGGGAPFATVFSMHATKPFATAEGGLIYSGDTALIDELRSMSNYGFDGARSAVRAGMNAKLPEVIGLLALARLDSIDTVAEHRAALAERYRSALGEFATLQTVHAARAIPQFMPLLLPKALAPQRAAILADLADEGIGAGHYFSPHLAQQPYFQRSCIVCPTPIADSIGARMLSLPISDAMQLAHVDRIAGALARASAPKLLPARPKAEKVHDTLLIGGGPAGIAMLIAASKQGSLPAFAQGLVVAERSARLGGGQLDSYAITSDSTAETFLSAAKDNPHPEIAELVDHPSGQDIARYAGRLGVPLARTGGFLDALGDRIGAVVRAHGCTLLMQHEAIESRRTQSGLWQTELRDAVTGATRSLLSRQIVLATGGYQKPEDVAAAMVAGKSLGDRLGDRLLASDGFLRLGGPEALRQRLADRPAPRIAIVGGSTSALASAALLLKSDLPLGQAALTLIHRTPLRPFYPSAEAALADGFTDFGPDDICPVSGFVYRLAGFRLEARELVLRMLGIGGRAPDPRLKLLKLDAATEADAAAALDSADIVIGALGYRPHALPLRDAAGQPIALSADAPGRPRLIDQQCRVIDADGAPLPGAYGIGLAAGFVPEGALGGERSFKGKANGLWLWQNDVGQLIVNQILAGHKRGRKAA